MKKTSIFGLVFLVLAFSVFAGSIDDNFNDNMIDNTIWHSVNTSGDLLLNESNFRIEISGNQTGSCAGSNQVLLQTVSVLNASDQGCYSIDVDLVDLISNSNDHLYVAVSDHVTGNSWSAAPPTYCGVSFDFTNGNVRVIRNYPSAALVGTIGVQDTDTHQIDICVSREVTRTNYHVYWDDAQFTVVQQDSACSNPTVNFSIAMCGTGNDYDEATFDNFEFEFGVTNNGTGAGCTQNSDCDSGKCSYGFCALKLGNEGCSSDDQCLSGVCSNNKCTRPSFVTQIDTAKTEWFGDSSNTNNFVALFISVGALIAIISASGGQIWGVGIGIAAFIGLNFFLAIIGWLSPFILLGMLIVMLIILVFIFMLKGGAGD